MNLTDILSKGLLTFSENDTFYYAGIAIILLAGYLIGSFDLRHLPAFSEPTRKNTVLAAAADILEGALCVVLGLFLMPGDGYGYVMVMACMAGHIFPVYFKFKGTSCIFVFAAGSLLMNPVAALFSAVIAVIVLLISRYKSAAYITAAAVFPIINYYIPFSLFSTDVTTVAGMINYVIRMMAPVLMAILMVIGHVNNIRNIANGTEKK